MYGDWTARATVVLLALLACAPVAAAESDCSLPQPFPVCGGRSVTVGKRRVAMLGPGVYGNVRVKNGAVLALEGGEYVFCELHVSRKGSLRFAAPATIYVMRDVAFSNASTVGPLDASTAPCDVRMVVAGDAVAIQRNASVALDLCAPAASLHVNNGASLTGTFVAHDEHLHRVARQGCPGSATTTSVTSTSTSSTSTSATVSPTTSTTSSSTTTVPSTTSTSTSATTPVTSTTSTSVQTTSTSTTPEPSSTTSTTGTVVTTTIASTSSSTSIPPTTSTSTTTTTSTTVTTTTTEPPAVCGDGTVQEGETCDDSNHVDESDPNVPVIPPDTCPSTCRIGSCSSSGTTRSALVSFSAPVGTAPVVGITVFVDYPDDKVMIPGSGSAVAASIGGLPPGALGSPNDLDYGLLEGIVSLSGIEPGQLFTIALSACAGAPEVVVQDFGCLVKDASDSGGNSLAGLTLLGEPPVRASRRTIWDPCACDVLPKGTREV